MGKSISRTEKLVDLEVATVSRIYSELAIAILNDDLLQKRQRELALEVAAQKALEAAKQLSSVVIQNNSSPTIQANISR